jgi:YHS domain-containing protein
MKKISMIVVIALILAVTGACVYAQAHDEKKAPVNAGNTVCPVMGTKVEPGKALTVEYGGKAYNVCCPICEKAFKKDPAKWADIAEKQMKEAGQKQ